VQIVQQIEAIVHMLVLEDVYPPQPLNQPYAVRAPIKGGNAASSRLPHQERTEHLA